MAFYWNALPRALVSLVKPLVVEVDETEVAGLAADSELSFLGVADTPALQTATGLCNTYTLDSHDLVGCSLSPGKKLHLLNAGIK